MRTKEEIQQDFARLCAQVGESTYRKAALEAQINHALGQIVQLEQEARGLSADAPSPAATAAESAD